ncbi:MAG: anti-sigma factor [Pseudonocardia sp.]
MSRAGEACAWNEQAAAYALHALEPGEAEALRAHLAGCESCRATVAETEDVAAAVAESAEPVEPPPHLRQQILAEVARTPQARTGPGTPTATGRGGGENRSAAGDRAATAAPARAHDGARGGHPTGAARPARGPGHRRRRLVAAALALAAVAAVVGGLVGYSVQVQRDRDARVAQAQALAELLVQLDRPGTSHATLATDTGEPVGVVVTTAATRTVVTAGLPANDRASTVYVLWGVGPAAPQPIGTFDVDQATAPAVHELGSPGGEQAFAGYAISLEPGRHAPATPTTVVATGTVPS